MTRFLLVANYQEYNISTVSDAMGRAVFQHLLTECNGTTSSQTRAGSGAGEWTEQGLIFKKLRGGKSSDIKRYV